MCYTTSFRVALYGCRDVVVTEYCRRGSSLIGLDQHSMMVLFISSRETLNETMTAKILAFTQV